MNELTRHTIRCSASIADHTGYHFRPCSKPAKFRVWFGNGPAMPYCGVHTNQRKKWNGCETVPLSDEERA